MEKMKVVVVTGLSGAGKSNAADWFEDQGYYCVDNLPPALIDIFIELCRHSTKTIAKAAIVTDVRGGCFFEELESCIEDLKLDDTIECKVMFMEADNETLLRRYSETRRNHPLSDGATDLSVIQMERNKLEPIRKKADFVVDTTNLKIAEFKHLMEQYFVENAVSEQSFAINITSFGFKYGIPMESDLVFDMRFIPNPYYVESMKRLTGNNKRVSAYVLKHQVAQDFLAQFTMLMKSVIPGYIKEGKYHLNISIGCTGGQHRSVAMANELNRILKKEGYKVKLKHRELK